MILKQVLNFCLGVLITIIVAFLGLLFTNFIEHGAGIFIGCIVIPILANLFYKKDKKQIAYGMVISLIPICCIGFALYKLSQLH